MKHCSVLTAGLLTFGVFLAAFAKADEKADEKIAFDKTRLDAKFRSEGVAIGDFNHDGKLDIAAGSVYYAAPDWKIHAIAEQPAEFDPKGYSNTFCNFADDIDGDGWTDLIVVDFPGKQTWWFENPRTAGGPWKRHECIAETNDESPTYLDVDGDGRGELVCSSRDRFILARPGDDVRKPWQVSTISASVPQWTGRFYHGLGVGDVNADGRNDVLIPDGWWESPASASQGEWKFHCVSFGPKCAQMYVYDFDGDGDNDVLTSSAHNYGVWWHEQTPDGWKMHEIDKSYSQTHGLCLADINGDGLPDFVTGKRWWAHGGHDPGGKDPAVFCWYELRREDGKPRWIRHQFDHDSGPGTQFQVADVNGDGLLDIVTSNKKGVHYFQQRR